MDSFWIGVLASFIGSFVLVLSLFLFQKPKFKIAKKIAYLDTDQYGDDLKGSYLIKVINKSFFVSYDLNANLESLTIYHVENGSNNRSVDLKIVDRSTNYLAGKHLFKNTGKSAFLFRTTEDLSGILGASDTKLRFTLIARNGFSGLTKIFRKEFNTVSCIKNGHYGFGKNFDIN
ncbi:hypothetical protein Q4Q35_16840 [Flavivirga aquimarina]|uniref:Phage protein n=1 Tax=Flavivirga aquimarina TaxID=2027862 RepID=A0ABT8WEE0_9FLAO|nr:hypothetical protein [Flavivirga aquimarina]MDO5971476.1 hypothetical protein [Flavivirga aquimarina]